MSKEYGFRPDSLSSVTAGDYKTGASANALADVFGTIDTSKHGKMAFTVLNTDSSNDLDYELDISGNPLDTVPTWTILETGTVVAGQSKTLERTVVSPATRLRVKSTVSGSAATYAAHYRLNPS
jgi:hypothetical protein